jgi:hypothetical protein
MPTTKKRISFYAEPAIEKLLAEQVALGYPLSGVIRAAVIAAYDPRFKPYGEVHKVSLPCQPVLIVQKAKE